MPDENRLPWIVRLLYDWPYALDLVDDAGEPDHGKMLPTFTAIAFTVFLFQHPRPSWEAMICMIVIGGYIYGYSAWLKVADAMASKIGATTTTVTTEEIHPAVADSAIPAMRAPRQSVTTTVIEPSAE